VEGRHGCFGLCWRGRSSLALLVGKKRREP
jgi:hypothetical protein